MAAFRQGPSSHRSRHTQMISVPYVRVINGLNPGRVIIIKGVVKENALRFAVNLCFHSGISLHYNPRFNDNVVVRNSLLQGKWGKEERTGGMPFFRGQPFTLTICCEAQSFRIMVNGYEIQHNYNYRHAFVYEINKLEIDGDISLTSVVI